MDRIEHSGVVKRVDAERVCVEITAHSACGSCKAREACGLGETGQKIVEIRTPAAATYRPGAAVLAELGSVVLYYGILWLLRRKIDNAIHFTISE